VSREWLTVNNARIRLQGNPLLWFGLLGSPVVWIVQLLLNWSLTEGVCSPQFMGFLSGPSTRLVVLLGGIVAIAIALAAGVASYQALRQMTRDQALPGEIAESRRFMALCGMLLSALFTLAIVFTTVPVLVLPCE
jgi:hypothetical protein